MPQRSGTSARDFYDAYVDRQAGAGVNERHRAVLRWLLAAGLRNDHRVLEVGCGIGTQTQLVAEFVREGRILAVDLSPRSIAVARERLARFRQVELAAGDFLEMKIEGRFDVVLLPDVLEHVPPERHSELFLRLARNVEVNGFVLIHVPDPCYQEYLQRTAPDLLQEPVDLPVHTDALCASAYPAGFYIHFLSTYEVWCPEGDYQVVVLRTRAARSSYTLRPAPRWARWRARLRSMLPGKRTPPRGRVGMARSDELSAVPPQVDTPRL
jgi:SAM-dependent methyltransferase